MMTESELLPQTLNHKSLGTITPNERVASIRYDAL